MPLIVICNPVSGDRTAAKLTTEKIIPLLATHNVTPDKVATTEYVGHAGELFLSYIDTLASSTRTEPITLVLVSGDGTLHEIVNALHSARSKQEGFFPSVRVVLIPGGTANALYSTYFPPSTPSTAEPALLASLLSFLSATPRLAPLTFAHVSVSSSSPTTSVLRNLHNFPLTASSSSASSDVDVISAVVTSTALHAAILHDSEALRASVPGVERYRLAAEQNATTWYRGHLNLFSPVQQYDVNTDTFIDLIQEEEVGKSVRESIGVAGPFVYFLSTVNVDRLEPLFRIAPLQRTMPPPPGAHTVDVLFVRPLLDISLEDKCDEEARERFKERVWGVLNAAYQDGAHIKAQYNSPDGKTEGMPVVEYYRVGGWQWIPVSLF